MTLVKDTRFVPYIHQRTVYESNELEPRSHSSGFIKKLNFDIIIKANYQSNTNLLNICYINKGRESK